MGDTNRAPGRWILFPFNFWLCWVCNKLQKLKKEEVEPADVTKLLQPQDENLMDEVPLCIDEQRKLFLKMESTPGEGALKAVEIKTEFRILHKLN